MAPTSWEGSAPPSERRFLELKNSGGNTMIAQFAKMETKNAQLCAELATAKPSTEQIETVNKLAAEAWQKNEDLEKRLSQVKANWRRSRS
ncbi:hypothetical protein QYE76_018854 [Lolium multiflorum]|uniref:Uncharacterized protein n=1 Tax=Lolium multiflorum TaxID=4521 RepID=A0AAD8QGF4_LOLMU|nr:hypothetical protein QYE76_018854 [Lolium multiflorum]